MGNLSFSDFRIVGRYLYCALLAVALLPSAPSHSAVRVVVPEIQPHRDHVILVQLSERDKLKNIQRLLTLLSERYKETYRTVNPGKVDGNYGAETKAAIQEYYKISGVEPSNQSLDRLTTEILATLAQMSAEQPAEDNKDVATQSPPSTAPAVVAPKPETVRDPTKTAKSASTSASDKPEPVSNSAPPASVSAADAAEATPPERSGSDSAAAPSTDASGRGGVSTQRDYGAPVPPPRTTALAAPETASAESPIVAQTPPAGTNDRVFFSQLASLRSLPSAQREWQRIFEANRAALNGEQVYFEEVEIAGRGIFHRILVGPIPERDSAIKLCGFLKQNDQPCVVISRLLSDLRRVRDQSLNLVPFLQPPTVGAPGPKAAPSTASDEDQPKSPAQIVEQPAAEPKVSTEPAAPASVAPAAPLPAPSADTETAVTSDPTLPTETSPSAPLVETLVADSPAPVGAEANTTPSEPRVPVASGPVVASPQPDQQTSPKAAASIDLSPPKDAATIDLSPPPTAATIDLTPPTTAENPAQSATILPLPPMQSPADTQSSEAGPVSGADRTASSGATPANVGVPAADTNDAKSGFPLLAVVIGILVVASALAAYVLWRRNRSRVISQILDAADGREIQTDVDSDVQTVSEAPTPADALKILETDFEGEQLRQSRSVRDEFLRDVLGDTVDAGDNVETKEPAIRINSRLKSLLVSDPAKYKKIFLNWIFLSKVGSALNEREISLSDINGHMGREFNILQNYFKIHLLELDDRHRIRRELPGLFYCLQLAQQNKREGGHAPSAAA